MNKWIKLEECPFLGRVILKDYEDLGTVVATTKFEKDDKLLYVYKVLKDNSFIFQLRDGDRYEYLSCIPEEVITNMVGTIICGDQTY